MLGPASALFPKLAAGGTGCQGLMHSLRNHSSQTRKQEPDIYPLHCRKPLMTQGLLPVHRNSQSLPQAVCLEVPHPAARCSSLPPTAQALVLVTGRKGTEGRIWWPLKAALRVSVPPR